MATKRGMNHARISFAISALALAQALSVQAAHAAGVTAGTLIQNTASATYGTGPATTTISSNTVTIKVDEAAPKMTGQFLTLM